MSDENNKSIQRELDFSLISKITERCNLSCSYCYLKDKKDLEMSINTAENLIREFLAFNKSFAHFTWVGGEPLLMPDSFFEEIKNFEEKYNINNLNVSHSIQTNGLKLTPNRFDNLKRMGFKIGISYDGTPDLQSERMNNNQIDISLDNIYYAKGKAGLLAVLSKKTIGKEEEIYDFFRRNTTFAKLNFFSPTGHGAEKKEELMLSKKEASDMLIKFYDLWKNDTSSLELRPPLEIVRSFFTGFPVSCDYSAISCYKILGSDSQGDIYPCSKAMNYSELRMGNINDGLVNLVGSEIHKMPLLRYKKLKKENDPWFHLSSGGCIIEAKSDMGDYMKPTIYSEDVRYNLFEKIYEDMKDEKIRNLLEEKVGLI